MARILAISSQVARGHVGLSAIVPALQMLGHEVIALPTILLSNHPGHARFAGKRVAPELLREMLDALDANGWLGEVDAVLTGYLPSAEHVAFAADAIGSVLLTRPRALRFCDPVMGDEPKGLYIEPAAARAICGRLVPSASIATPNAFELDTITGLPCRSVREVAIALKSPRAPYATVAKSIPGDTPTELFNVAAVGGKITGVARVTRRAMAQNGTGDLMAALIAAATIAGRELADAMALATAVLDRVLAASAGRDELDLRMLPRSLAEVEPWPLERP